MRSTPTPAEIFRTVKFSEMPPPRLAITRPSNAWRRSFSPSFTRTMTRTVSPGSKAGMSARRPSLAAAAKRSIVTPSAPSRRTVEIPPSLVMIPGPQVGPALAGEPLRLFLPPCLDLGMIARPQHLGHLEPPVHGRPGIAGRAQQPVVVRVAAGRLVIAERSGQQPYHRIDHAEGGRLAAAQDEVAHRNLLGR